MPSLTTTAHHRVDQFVERHTIWLQALLLHLIHQASRLFRGPIVQVCLNECVERDNVCHASSSCVLHPRLCGFKISAFHTSIQHCVVHDAIHVHTLRSRDSKTLLAPLRLCSAAKFRII